MDITKEDIKRFNKTNPEDICFNDSYNLSKGYCKYDVFRKLQGIRISHYGLFSKGKPLTTDILKNYPSIVKLV